jgi:hypothetical protein
VSIAYTAIVIGVSLVVVILIWLGAIEIRSGGGAEEWAIEFMIWKVRKRVIY